MNNEAKRYLSDVRSKLSGSWSMKSAIISALRLQIKERFKGRAIEYSTLCNELGTPCEIAASSTGRGELHRLRSRARKYGIALRVSCIVMTVLITLAVYYFAAVFEPIHIDISNTIL